MKFLFSLNSKYIFTNIIQIQQHSKMKKLPNFRQLQELRKALQGHKIYGSVKSTKDIKIFMEAHVFAVWDFMMLLKGLQRRLTCTQKIWVPPASINTARFINEIVVGEETDVHPDGVNYISHYELYLEAMKEVGANTSVIVNFVENLKKGKSIHSLLRNEEIPPHVRKFVANTVSSLDKSTPYIASQFFYGRQDPIPQMFQKFVNTLQDNNNCNFLKYYLKRHIQVDSEDHGPMAEKLMDGIAKREDKDYKDIMSGAINAIQHRIQLWDGIHEKIKQANMQDEKKTSFALQLVA